MEIPVFHYSEKILDILGIRGMIIVAHVAYVVRVFSYCLLTKAWLVLAVEVLHGLTYALLWPAGVAFASRSVPPELETTAQGVFGGIFGGLGTACGSLAGGIVYDMLGPKILFFGSGCTLLLSALLFGLTYSDTPTVVKSDLSVPLLEKGDA